MLEDEIVEKGYKKAGNNIYKKDGIYYVQRFGELVVMESVQDDILEKLTGGDYKNFKDKPRRKKTVKPMKKKVSKKEKEQVLETRNEAYDQINLRDDAQVLMEMQGRFLDEFVYSFKTSQGKVTGLSWAGVKEVSRQRGNISVEDCLIDETEGTYRVKCRARDTLSNVSMFGVAEQSKSMLLKSGERVEDLHALSKCVSRAQRNALRSLIPEIFIKKMIEEYQKN